MKINEIRMELKTDIARAMQAPSPDKIVECLEPLANEIKVIQTSLASHKLGF
jgi:hypothetical protein